jgi:NAD(P)-dependent dehydrogenase (short-subunit alcohol dehydrogenase family)
MTHIMDKFNLDQRVAIVTGGAGLLGRQFCRTLAQAGAKVIIADLFEESAKKLEATLREEGLNVTACQVNVTDESSVAAMIQTALKTYGSVDVLVSSAAMDPKFDDSQQGQHTNNFETYPVQAFREALDVNLTGMFLCAREAVKPMLEQNRGSIINICSTYGLVGPDQRLYERDGKPKQFKPVFYSVTKAGVLGLTRYLATYYAGTKIRANALTPGGVFNNHDDEFAQKYAARTVIGRMAEQDEMNGAILYLASDASSYMTGSNLVVDGGWTAW